MSRCIFYFSFFLATFSFCIVAVNGQQPSKNLIGIIGSIANSKKIQAEYFQHPPFQQFDKPLIFANKISSEAYAYMFCSRPELGEGKFMYYQALLLNLYKLKAQNEAMISKPRDILVLVCSYTPTWQIIEMNNLGVIVIVVDPIIPSGKISAYDGYLDQFTKYHLFRLTEWERILYLDIDTNIQKQAYLIWDDPSTQLITGPPPEYNKSIDDDAMSYNRSSLYPYLMAAALDWPCRLSPIDCDPYFRNYFNAGLFMIKPSMDHFHMLIAEMNKNTDRRDYMEQDLMNLVYRKDGELPWKLIPLRYNSYFGVGNLKDDEISIIHTKLWSTNCAECNDYVKAKCFTWHSELQNFLHNNMPFYLHLYYPDDIIYIGSQKPLREAYVFVVADATNPDNPEGFITYRNLMGTIKRLHMMDDERDVIIITSESLSESHRKELSDINVFAIRVKSIKDNNFLKPQMWKLIHWHRLLYIDLDLNIINLTTFLDIWRDPQATQQDSSKAYLFAAAPDFKDSSQFGLHLFMFKPSIEGFDHLLRNLEDQKFTSENELLNYQYNQAGPLFLWSVLSSSYAQQYLTESDMRAYYGKLWNQRDNSTLAPIVQQYWTIFSNFTEPNEPHCKVYFDIDDYHFFYTPQEIDEGGVPACSKDCEKCLKTNTCDSCRTNDATCIPMYSDNKDRDGVLAYCSVCEGNKCKYITKGHFEYQLLGIRLILFIIGIIIIATLIKVVIIIRRRYSNYANLSESTISQQENKI